MLALGGRLAHTGLAGRQVTVFLLGDLGAGKTTLARGFLRALGFAGTVKSPTYTLIEPYHVAGVTVYHIDLYRLNDPQEVEFTGLRDLLAEPVVSLIEWPERAAMMLPSPDLEVHIQRMDAGRDVTLVTRSDVGKHLFSAKI